MPSRPESAMFTESAKAKKNVEQLICVGELLFLGQHSKQQNGRSSLTYHVIKRSLTSSFRDSSQPESQHST